MIFQNEPKDWKELELLTQQLFVEMGCQSEIGKRITTARGPVVIDVYVKDFVSSPPLIYLCECKQWNVRLPKFVIHSFRTVVNDSGANRGYIISKVGFQSGAFEAAVNSNIELVTWNQFQELFENRWFNAMKSRLNLIATQINQCNLEEFIGLEQMTQQKKNYCFIDLISRMACIVSAISYIDYDTKKDFPWEFTDPHKRIISINSLREYFDFLIPLAEGVLSDIQRLTTSE